MRETWSSALRRMSAFEARPMVIVSVSSGSVQRCSPSNSTNSVSTYTPAGFILLAVMVRSRAPPHSSARFCHSPATPDHPPSPASRGPPSPQPNPQLYAPKPSQPAPPVITPARANPHTTGARGHPPPLSPPHLSSAPPGSIPPTAFTIGGRTGAERLHERLQRDTPGPWHAANPSTA